MNLEWLRVGVIGVFFAIVGTGCTMDTGEEQAASPMAKDAQSTDWELLGKSSDLQHHSDLSQISTETVSDLGLAWAIDLPTRDGLVGNPLISNGRIFQGGSQSQVFANDLKTGKLLWTFEPLADRPPGSFLETW
jgi:quinohemoprotein ethanol dehydrogenase